MTFKELIETKEVNEINYFDLLGCDEWKSKRKEILQRDENKCVKCQRQKTFTVFSGNSKIYFYKSGEETISSEQSINLQIHHKLYIYNKLPWDYDSEDLETLCNLCHEKLHNNEDIIIWDNHKLNRLKFGRCEKCSGKGYIKEFKHVSNGICFQCGGYGYNIPLINLKS